MVTESAQSFLEEHVTPARKAAVAKFLEELPEPEGDIFEVIEEAEYEAAKRVNPSLPPFSYLVVRLMGDVVSGGGVNHDVAKELLGPIGAEIQAAADKQSANSEMTLVRISKGSLVLHYQAKQPLVQAEADQADIQLSPVDQAVRDTFELHDMLERGVKPSIIASRFGENKKFMRSARALTEALDKLNLDMSGKWRSPMGGRAQVHLTEVGRAHARGVFKRIDRPDNEIITGRITALDLDGIVTIQQTVKRKRKVHLDDPGLLTAGGFGLGREVSLRVEKNESRDEIGLTGKERLVFKGFVEQGQLDI